MAKSYYKQSERPVVEGVDWGQISTDLSTKLATEQKRREDLKTQLDTESRDYMSEFNDTPQGQHVGSNERMARFADDASMYMLDLDKKLKSGQLPLRDYNAMRANLQQGTTDMFNVSNKFNTNYDASLLRAGSGEASAEEVYQNAQLQAFGDPSSTGIYIDPVSGQMSLAKLVDDGNGKLVPSSKPSDRKSVFSLKNSVERKINNFNMKEFSEGIKGEYDVKFQKILNDPNTSEGTKTSMLESEDFKEATDYIISGELVNTHNAASILTNRAGKEYTFETLDTNKLPDVPKEGVIYLVPDPTNPNSGATQPLLTKNQTDEATEILRTSINSKIGVEVTEFDKEKKKSQILANDLKGLEIDYKKDTLDNRTELANLSVDKIEQDIKQGKEKHDASMKAATTKEEKAQVEAVYYEENLNQRNLLLAAQVKNAKKTKQWEDVKEESKAVIRNSVAKVGNLFNIEEGSDATIDDAISFVRSLDSTIEDIIRTKDGLTIIRLDDDGLETSKKINANTKKGFIEAVMGEVAQEYNVVQYLDELDIDNDAEYQVDKGITETNDEKIIIRDTFINDSVTDGLFIKPQSRIGKDEESSQDYFNKNFGPNSDFASLGLESSVSSNGTIKITVGKDGVEDSDGNEISLTIRPQMFTGNNIDSNKKAMKDFITRVTDLNLEDFTGSISKKPTPSSTPKKKTPISI